MPATVRLKRKIVLPWLAPVASEIAQNNAKASTKSAALRMNVRRIELPE